MEVEPTCRFCHRKMTNYRTLENDQSLHGSDAMHVFDCLPCHSTQTFSIRGQTIAYFFDVGEDYRLFFYPQNILYKFIVSNRKTSKVAMELEEIPHQFTPQNMTEEKVKTLILFS